MRELVIMPAHNEGASILGVAEELRRARPGANLIIVDDASTDATVDICRAAGENVLTLSVNLGIGGAVKAGFKYAVEEGYDIALQLDSDGQHDPAFIDAVLDPIRKGLADMVIGSRFLDREGYQSEFSRRIGIKLFSWVTSRIIGSRVTDITSGYRAIGRRLIECFARVYPVEHPDAEAIIMANRLGYRIVEVPVVMRPRTKGVSYYSLGRKMAYPMNTMVSILATVLRANRYYGG